MSEIQDRSRYIGGSDIAVILGLSKWKSPLDLWNEKMELTPPLEDNERMYWGRMLEGVVRREFESQHTLEIEKPEDPALHPKHPFLGCQVDGLFPGHIFEAKTTSAFAKGLWGETGSSDMPIDYHCQCQWNMGISDRGRAALAVLIGGQEYREYFLDFIPEQFDAMVNAALEFYDRLESNNPPPPDRPEDLAFLFEKEDLIPGTCHIQKVCQSLAQVKGDIKLLTGAKEELEETLKLAIGDSQGVAGLDYKVTWKSPKEKDKTDWELLAKELQPRQEIIDKHTKAVRGARRFSFTHQFTLGG